MIKAVFFDLYHTLICYDPPQEESLARVLNDFGIEVAPEVLRRPIVVADEFIYQEHSRLSISKRSDEEKKSLFAQYQAMVLKEAGIEPTDELIGNILSKMQQIKFSRVLFDDVLPVLTELKGKELILGLISNVDSDITPLLDKLGLSQLLQVVVTSQETGYMKPQPEIFKEAAKQACVQVSEAIYIGDQYQIDVLGAKKAGMQGVLLDRNSYFEEVTKELKIQNLYQLVEYLS
jgi:putative hydrolase of the HAD superfamily